MANNWRRSLFGCRRSGLDSRPIFSARLHVAQFIQKDEQLPLQGRLVTVQLFGLLPLQKLRN